MVLMQGTYKCLIGLLVLYINHSNINAALTTINTNSGGLNIIGDTNITGTGTFYSTSEGKVIIDGDGNKWGK